MFGLFNWGFGEHSYSLCYINGSKQINGTYSSRESATKKMHEICDRKNMHIVKVWDDKHDKTYFTNTGAEFHINRVF